MISPAEGPGNDSWQFSVGADHPALAGHFPGQPIIPAVILLDQVLARATTRQTVTPVGISRVKFLAPVKPGQTVEASLSGNGAFELRCLGQIIAKGQLQS